MMMSCSESRYEAGDIRDKAFGICRDFLSGSWKKISSDDMVFKPITGGLSNILYLCSLPSTHTPLNGEPSQVLLRMYGQIHTQGETNGLETTTITDSVIFMLLSERKLGPKLYGIFPGGRLEEYIPARAMTCRELRDPYLSSIIAKKLANVHTLNVPIHKEPTWLFEVISGWLETVRSKSVKNVPDLGNKKLAGQLMSFDFENEIIWLQKVLKSVRSPVVFCHNDLQEGNILLPDLSQAKKKRSKPNFEQPAITEDQVVLIDFEYCSYNYRGFDIANHFCEWAFDYSNPNYPCFYANESDYPSDKQRRMFVREYLNQYRRLTNEESSEQYTEEFILKEAEIFMLASHFLWTLWSINNAFTSQITFGYWEYGRVRLNAYLKLKEKLRQTLLK